MERGREVVTSQVMRQGSPDLASAAVSSDFVEVRAGDVHSAHDQVGADLALVPARGVVQSSELNTE